MSTIDHLAWRTSTRSSDGEKCVEVAPTPRGVVIRHSKHPHDGTITFPYPEWSRFLREALDHPGEANSVVTIATSGPDTLVCSVHGEVTLRFDHEQWTAFRHGAMAGEFDFTAATVTPG